MHLIARYSGITCCIWVRIVFVMRHNVGYEISSRSRVILPGSFKNDVIINHVAVVGTFTVVAKILLALGREANIGPRATDGRRIKQHPNYCV